MTDGRLVPEEVRTRTFSRVVRGYRPREVRRLLERAATDLARLRNGLTAAGPDDPLPLTPEEIEEARFQPALGGYEMNEVDEFLDLLAEELDRAAREPFRPSSALPAPRPREAPRPPPPEEPATPPPALQPPPAAGPATASATAEWPPAPGSHAGPPVQGRPGSAPPLPRSPALGSPPAGPAPGPPATGPPPPGPQAGWGSAGPPASAPPPAPEFPETLSLGPPPPGQPAPAPEFPEPPPRPPAPPPVRPLTPSEVETRTFERGAPGYLPAHVDLFLAKAARALAGRDGEELNRWDVLRQRFPLGPRGYATGEVDAFLVRLAAQFPEPDPAAQQEILRKLQGG
jgi:DivIVA domain-containing protein